MKIGIIILTGVYLIVIIFSSLEILRGDIMDGIVGFIIAIGIYKFTKFMSWKPQFINKSNDNEASEK